LLFAAFFRMTIKMCQPDIQAERDEARRMNARG